MTKFAGRRGDETWGPYDYSVTPSQKMALEALRFLMSGLPRAHPANDDMPQGYFCSQQPNSGTVIMGINHKSVSVYRSGRITSNEVFTSADVA